MAKISKNKKQLLIIEYIDAIEQNYPPEHEVMFREALDYCLKMLKTKLSVD